MLQYPENEKWVYRDMEGDKVTMELDKPQLLEKIRLLEIENEELKQQIMDKATVKEIANLLADLSNQIANCKRLFTACHMTLYHSLKFVNLHLGKSNPRLDAERLSETIKDTMENIKSIQERI